MNESTLKGKIIELIIDLKCILSLEYPIEVETSQGDVTVNERHC